MNTLPMLYLQGEEGAVLGPLTPFQVRDMMRQGKVVWTTLAAQEGDDEWLPLKTFEDLLQPPASSAVIRASVAVSDAAPLPSFNLVKAGVLLLLIGLGLGFLFGVGLVEALLAAVGIILLVVGLCRG